MIRAPHDPPELFPPYRGYVHALEIQGGSRLLFISGLNGYEPDGATMPDGFEAQAELIWKHIRTILTSAGMHIAISSLCLRSHSPSRPTRRTIASEL